ncbi:peptidoglycan bridge formation glycyltransferase FemA/FemB family protein [Candidatus Saccharibacteria bacterium]|nr:peptidoglycan bridge formation glycyltransferase FemA/FemB family protein [Candidatus Saccharibacteria bacterium]
MHSDYAPEKWDELQRHLGSTFLQSAGWAEFQRAMGHQVHLLAGEDWSCLLISRKAQIGSYVLAPYGPTIGPKADSGKIFEEIKRFGRLHKLDWLRLEPVIAGKSVDEQKRLIRNAGGRVAANEFEPSMTRIVDLTRPSDEILASFSQTTRNIIRRNQRESTITFKTSSQPADISILTAMLEHVAKRQQAVFFGPEYFKTQAELLMPAKLVRLEVAYDGDKPVAAAWIHNFNDTAYYTNAASLPEARDKNVSALLLWQVMLNAKKNGNHRIDLFGIAPDDAGPKHPWYGFSGFKKKFGGEVVERAGTWDFPLTAKYKLYKSALMLSKLGKRH